MSMRVNVIFDEITGALVKLYATYCSMKVFWPSPDMPSQ